MCKGLYTVYSPYNSVRHNRHMCSVRFDTILCDVTPLPIMFLQELLKHYLHRISITLGPAVIQKSPHIVRIY